MVAPDLPIGDRIRHYRRRRGTQQDVLAGLVGITPDYLGQIERGLKVPTVNVLHLIARELGVPTAALLSDTPAPAPSVVDTTEPSIVQALMGFGPPRAAEPCPPPLLRERVESAWRMWQSSPTRFTDAGGVLPALIGDVEHAARANRSEPEAHREVLRAAADLYFLLRSYLRRTGRVDLSLMAADRAVRAAEDADDPLRIAAAQWNLGHVLLAAGEPDGAEQIALQGAEAMHELAEASADLRAKAMEGALQLVAVIAASRRRQWWAARDRLHDLAAPVARITGEGNVMWTAFGPTNVELHDVSVSMEAGDAAEGLHRADEIDTRPLLSREREFTFTLEVARCYDLRREDAAVLLYLLDLEQMAPEDLARAPLARDMVLGLMRRARAMQARQAEALAGRMGLV